MRRARLALLAVLLAVAGATIAVVARTALRSFERVGRVDVHTDVEMTVEPSASN